MTCRNLLTALSLALVSALSAAPASAQFAYYRVESGRWGLSGASIGTEGFTVENFEDAALVPGMSIKWLSTSGNAGPFTTLPNTFNPAADPNGNAFVPGAWDGGKCVINCPNNLSHPYSQAQYFGDIEFTFSPAVRAAGFSLQQCNLPPRIYINNVSRGYLSNLVPVSIDGGRQGYFVVETTSTQLISSIRIGATGGDGIALDHVAFTTVAGPKVTVTGNAVWGASDAALGIAGLAIEDFEDQSVTRSLKIEWETPVAHPEVDGILPATFTPSSDPHGTAFNGGLWDGIRGLINTADNTSHPYSASEFWGDVSLVFQHPVTTVGFSLAQTEFDPPLLINGRFVGHVSNLTGLTTITGIPSGYVRVTAVGATTISSVRLNNGRYGANDGFILDHVAFTNVCPCAADYTCDSVLNSGDFLGFLVGFSGADSDADIDHSLEFDSADFLGFLLEYANACE